MNLSLRVEGVAEVQDKLRQLPAKVAKPATVRWANWVGLEAQGEMRKQLPTRFSFRGTADPFRKAIVFQAAQTKGDRELQAKLVVGAPGGGTKASATQNLGRILARHEDPSTRTTQGQVFYNGRGQAMLGLGFFLPAKGMRTPTRNPPRAVYPANIGAALRKAPDAKPILASGTKKGTKKTGTGTSYFATRKGIFRRKHTSFGGRVQVEALWWFNRTIRTPARLGLWTTAERVFQLRAIPLGMQAIEETLFRMGWTTR